MNRIWFDSRREMIAHAKQHGGWCAVCDDGTFQWFAPGKWTMTPIIRAVGCSAEIGPWTRFADKVSVATP
jgi:hypothetical protein